MKEFDLADITDHCYHDGSFSMHLSSMNGEFPDDETERSGLVSFYFYFGPSAEVQGADGLPELEDAEILDFDIKKIGGGYEITINCLEYIDNTIEHDFHHLKFTCQYIICHLKKYSGFSYHNVFDAKRFFPDDLGFLGEKDHSREYDFPLGENISVHCAYYEAKGEPSQNGGFAGSLVKNTFIKDGEVIFEHFSDPQHLCRFREILHHRNGHRYYVYHTDLYGLSLFDIDTGAHYDYVPEGFEHDFRMKTGESFIITDICYDPDSDLLACGGCYWAGTSEVFVLDLSHPMHYDPRAVRLYDEIFSPEDDGDDFDVLRWEKDALLLKLPDGQERCVTKVRLNDLLSKKKIQ